MYLKHNSEVLVKLTAHGQKIIQEYNQKYGATSNKETDPTLVRLELWEFLEIFGPHSFLYSQKSFEYVQVEGPTAPPVVRNVINHSRV
jgi:hypothetical protein